MESWRKVWRTGIAPLLSVDDLLHLEEGLSQDDQHMIQGATTQPPPLQCVADWEVEGCCALSYVGWKQGLKTVGEVEEFFARMCFEIDQLVGEPAGCRWFLNWFDESPREQMRLELLEEIRLLLQERMKQNQTVPGVNEQFAQQSEWN